MIDVIWPDELIDLFPDARRHYPDDVAAELCTKFEIPEDKTDRFLNYLALAARNYFRYRETSENHKPRTELQVRLKSVAAAAQRLELQLRDALTEFRMPLENAWRELIRDAEDEASPIRVIGAAKPRKTQEHEFIDLLDLDDAIAATRMVSLCADRAPSFLKAGRPGRQRRFHVDSFVHLHCQFWEEDLGRHVTYDQHDGYLTSPVGEYLSDVMHAIDPDAVAHLRQGLLNRQTAP